VLVPFTGHSVIGSDLGDCASKALTAFFAGAAVTACTPSPDEFAPTPLTPTKLAYVHPPAALGGRRGQTLVAVLDTLVDLNRQVIGATLQAGQELPTGASFGGLRGGFATLTPSRATLHAFSFVPGVELTGTFPVHDGVLQAATITISGGAASPGTIRVGSHAGTVSGTLSGRRFDVHLAKVRLSRVGGGEWPALQGIIGQLARTRGAAASAGALPPRLP
jgi:hypothetical protein